MKDSFMDFMGYRNMIIEDKISECIKAYRSGESEVEFDSGDLTDDEIKYIQKEVIRRIYGK